MEPEKAVKPLIIKGKGRELVARREYRPTGDDKINSVYERVKAQVVARDLPSGKRIQPEPLAERLSVSSTPVREALIRLTAERVIERIPKAGFFVKELSESELVNLYGLQHHLLDWSLQLGGHGERRRKRANTPKFLSEMRVGASVSPQTAVSVVEDLFVQIANRSGNFEVIQTVRNVNDRTRYVRLKDYEEYGDPEHRLPELHEAYWGHRSNDFLEGLDAYFRDQVERLPALLRILKVTDL